MDVMYFETREALRAWLEENHDTAKELHIGYYKVGSGRTGVTYKESVDEALCFGWIDGVRRSIDAVSYANRFTPRKPRSIWSAVNIKRVGELIEMGRMHPAGIRAFEGRDPKLTNQYSGEQRREDIKLTHAQEAKFRANPAAWANFEKMSPSYIKNAVWWLMSAKQDATREKRLDELIACSEQGIKIKPLRTKKDKAE